MIWAPIGVSMVAGSLAMLRSRLFPAWLSWLGLVSGALVVCGGVIGASALGSSGAYHTLGGILSGVPGFGFWIWMIATAIVLFRAARAQGQRQPPQDRPRIRRPAESSISPLPGQPLNVRAAFRDWVGNRRSADVGVCPANAIAAKPWNLGDGGRASPAASRGQPSTTFYGMADEAK